MGTPAIEYYLGRVKPVFASFGLFCISWFELERRTFTFIGSAGVRPHLNSLTLARLPTMLTSTPATCMGINEIAVDRGTSQSAIPQTAPASAVSERGTALSPHCSTSSSSRVVHLSTRAIASNRDIIHCSMAFVVFCVRWCTREKECKSVM